MELTELEEIIAYYQEEQSRIQAEMDEALEDGDYLTAHEFSKALTIVGEKLRSFNRIVNPNTDRISFLEQQISIYTHLISQADEWGHSTWERVIEELNEKLEELNALSPTPRLDNQILFDQLNRMTTSSLRGFKLHLNTDDNLYLVFQMIDKAQLSIAITPDKALGHNSNSRDWDINSLKKIGFRLDDQKWSAVFDLSSDPFFNNLFQHLSRLIFDTFTHIRLDKESTIELL